MIIYGKEKEILKAQKRSLAAWINNTIGATVVDVDNLIPKLSTGVILCKLAKYIQRKVDETQRCYGKTERQFQLKYWESAKRESFFARDNAELFIRWCKSFGVRDAVLFESDGLVLQTQPRTVILCLLELSRLAAKYGVLLPPPIQIPQTATITIDDDVTDCSDDEFFFATSIPSPTSKIQRWDSGCSSGGRSPSSSSLYSKTSSPNSSLKRSSSSPKKRDKNVVVVVRSHSDNFLADGSNLKKSPTRISSTSLRRNSSSLRTDTISSRMRSNLNLSRSSSSIGSSRSLAEKSTKRSADGLNTLVQRRRSTLDKRVLEVVKQFHKDESKVHRISEGHYCFGDKNVFLRIVRGNNVVVRLGGGWDTLEHFLSVLDLDKTSTYGKTNKKIGNLKRRYAVKNISPYMTL